MTTALFLLDTTMNTLMLALAVRLGGGRIRAIRVLAGAAYGAAMAQGMDMLPLARGQGALLWLPIAAVMMRIARGNGAKGRMIRQAMLLLCASGLTGGMVLALWGAMGSLGMAYVLGGVAAACVGTCAVYTGRTRQAAIRAKIACTYRGRRVRLDAMIDSGNTLRDYLTHLPVIVLPQAAAERALHLGQTPLRPIFAETAGGRQRMSVFSPQEIELECHGIHRRVRAVIALSPQMSADVPALVPAALLDGQGN